MCVTKSIVGMTVLVVVACSLFSLTASASAIRVPQLTGGVYAEALRVHLPGPVFHSSYQQSGRWHYDAVYTGSIKTYSSATPEPSKQSPDARVWRPRPRWADPSPS